MSIIVPAILPNSAQDLEEKLAALLDIPLVDEVQIDAVDGRFATPACWPYSTPHALAALAHAGRGLPHVGRFVFDADLMVDDPEQAVDTWSALGATRLTIHAESVHSLPRTLALIREKHGHERGFAPGMFSLGLAINTTTDPGLILPHLHLVDYVQLMGIASIGKQSQPFDPRVIKNIRAIRAVDTEITIQIDGAVTLSTAPELLAAGANRLVIGHALWQAPDLEREIRKFLELAERTPSKVL